MAKVIITGANGFLGSWLTRELVRDGHQVSVLVRKGSDVSELNGIDCDYRYGDVTQVDTLLNAFIGMDTVFHLAGLIEYRKSARQKMELVNVTGTLNVVQAIQKSSVRKLVHLSSVVAVGAGFTKNDILNENSTYNVSHLNLGYFETKKKAEELVLDAFQKKQIDAVILNPSTIYGRGDARKRSRKTQIKVAQGKFPFYTNGGVNVVAVEDVVQGILSAWKKGRSGERYILSSENLTIQQLFTEIAHAAGSKPPHILLPDPVLHLMGGVGDILQLMGIDKGLSRENAWTSTLYHWFDSTKAQSELDFKPRPAKMAIQNSVQWMKEHGLIS